MTLLSCSLDLGTFLGDPKFLACFGGNAETTFLFLSVFCDTDGRLGTFFILLDAILLSIGATFFETTSRLVRSLILNILDILVSFLRVGDRDELDSILLFSRDFLGDSDVTFSIRFENDADACMFCFDFCGLFTIAVRIMYLDVKEFSSTSLVMLPKFCEGEIAEKGLGSV